MGFKTATELIEELDGRSASALGQSSSTGDDALGGVVFMCRYARASDASARAKFARRATAASLRCSSRFRGAICGTTACSRDALLGDCDSTRSYHRLGTIRRAGSVFPRHNHLDPPRPDSQVARSPNSPTFSHHFRSDATFDDTMRNGLFGLTQQSWSFVKDIQPGMPLFLYNLTERRFHGVFEAVRAERPQRDPPTLDLAAQQA